MEDDEVGDTWDCLWCVCGGRYFNNGGASENVGMGL